MQFNTTDLLVTVLPKLELNKDALKVCLFHTIICRHPTFGCQQCSIFVTCKACSLAVSCVGCSVAVSCIGCSVAISHGCGFGCSVAVSQGCGFGNSCGAGGSACDPTYVNCFGGSRDPFVIEHLEDLVALKADLQSTLRQLEVIQKEGLPSGIASKADAEAMEKSLTEALEQVRAAKQNLE